MSDVLVLVTMNQRITLTSVRTDIAWLLQLICMALYNLVGKSDIYAMRPLLSIHLFWPLRDKSGQIILWRDHNLLTLWHLLIAWQTHFTKEGL
jgi:hypothetical protein